MTLTGENLDVNVLVEDRHDTVPAHAPLGPGKQRRLHSLGAGDGRFLFVPMDHSVSDGPIASARRFRAIVREVAR